MVFKNLKFLNYKVTVQQSKKILKVDFEHLFEFLEQILKDH
jgi:hypothetical protein